MTTDFWLRKLQQSGSAPARAAPQAGLTPQGAPWWAHPTYAPAPQPAAPQEPAQPGGHRTDKAQSAKVSDRCPSCGSDHYWRPTPRTSFMCADCQYPVQNSTQGQTIANSESPARASLHQAQGSGYRPDVIVGRM